MFLYQQGSSHVTVGRYQYMPKDVIGRGSSSTVYLGTETTTGEKVAIKQYNPASRFTLQCATREVKVLMHLPRHKHVVKFLQYVELEGNRYIVTEYCQETLKGRLKRKGALAEQ